MSQVPSPLEDLQAFREILVAARRRVVRQVHELREDNRETEPSAGARWGADFKAIQDQIEAVDRAIKEEELAEPSVYETRGIVAS